MSWSGLGLQLGSGLRLGSGILRPLMCMSGQGFTSHKYLLHTNRHPPTHLLPTVHLCTCVHTLERGGCTPQIVQSVFQTLLHHPKVKTITTHTVIQSAQPLKTIVDTRFTPHAPNHCIYCYSTPPSTVPCFEDLKGICA